MAQVIEYYQEYLNLKAHFNSKTFIYGKNSVPFIVPWNRESELKKNWWRRIQQEITLLEFRKMCIANFLVKPKTYYLSLKDNLEIVVDFNRYWSNYVYWFEKDMNYLNSNPAQDICKEIKSKTIRIETLMFLFKFIIGGFILNGVAYDWQNTSIKDSKYWGEYELRIEKYLKLIENKINWKDLEIVLQKTLQGE
jgi:hypothetical protein